MSEFEEQAFIAGIEADYENMNHSDLVLTCRMLVRGRERWRKESEQLAKALELKLDAMPSGLSAGQSIKLQTELTTLRQKVDELEAQASVMRDALKHCLEASSNPEKYGRYLSQGDREIIAEAIKPTAGTAMLERVKEAEWLIENDSDQPPDGWYERREQYIDQWLKGGK